MKIILLLAVGAVQNILCKNKERRDKEDWSDDEEQLDYYDSDEATLEPMTDDEKDQSFLEKLDSSQTEDEDESQRDFVEYQKFLDPLELYFKQIQESFLRLRDATLEEESKLLLSQYSTPNFLQMTYDELKENAALRMMTNLFILSAKVLEKHNRKHDADDYAHRTSLPRFDYLPHSSLSEEEHQSQSRSVGRRTFEEEKRDSSDDDVERRKEKIEELDGEIGKMTERVGKLQRLMEGMKRIASKRILLGNRNFH